jgi:hypothetical protein
VWLSLPHATRKALLAIIPTPSVPHALQSLSSPDLCWQLARPQNSLRIPAISEDSIAAGMSFRVAAIDAGRLRVMAEPASPG